MDSLILQAVVRVLAPALTGQPLLRWDDLGDDQHLLRFASARADSLKISLRPPHPYLVRLAPRARVNAHSPSPFAARAHQELEGALLRRVRSHGLDRVVTLEWETPATGARQVVIELLGKSANLLLLDGSEKVVAYAREIASAFRAPRIGEAYRPPIPRRGFEDFTLDPERAGEYVARFAGADDSDAVAAATLLKGLSPPLAEDFPFREGAGVNPVAALSSLLETLREGRLLPTLYTSPPPGLPGEGIPDLEPPVLSPLPLARPPRLSVTSFSDPEEAVRAWAERYEGQREERERRERIRGALQRERARLEKLSGKLEAEYSRTDRAEEHRKWGDLILAHPGARVVDEEISVPDLYDPDAGVVRIPADPALSARENAERHYALSRKLRRGAETIRGRLEKTRADAARVAAWLEEAGRADTPEAGERLEAALETARILVRPRGDSRPGRTPPAPEGDPGIRKFRTADGYVILVGRTSRDNDRLTFQIAAPHDFWFHAADRSGAHVVVRNPSRSKELPPPVVQAAARIAAHFSRARGKGKVEVHYTRRKYVRKGRGFAPGLVTIRNHRTLEVVPELPGGPDGD